MQNKKFPNTFAPTIKNKDLTIDNIIQMLSLGFPFQELPKEIQQAVREETDRRHTKRYHNTFAPNTERHDLSLEDIIRKLTFHEIRPDDLPDDVRRIVDEEIQYRTNMDLQEWWSQYHAAKYEAIQRNSNSS